MTFKAFLRRLPVCCLICRDNFKPPSRQQNAACRIEQRTWEIEVNFIRLSSNILREMKVYDAIVSLCTVCVIILEPRELT